VDFPPRAVKVTVVSDERDSEIIDIVGVFFAHSWLRNLPLFGSVSVEGSSPRFPHERLNAARKDPFKMMHPFQARKN